MARSVSCTCGSPSVTPAARVSAGCTGGAARKLFITWTGTWKNQYGSYLEITSGRDGRHRRLVHLGGGLRSARRANPGDRIPPRGPRHVRVAGGQIVAAWTGLLRGDRVETLWHVAASERPAAPKEGAPAVLRQRGVFEAFTTGADTFARTEPRRRDGFAPISRVTTLLLGEILARDTASHPGARE